MELEGCPGAEEGLGECGQEGAFRDHLLRGCRQVRVHLFGVLFKLSIFGKFVNAFL